VLHIVDIVLLGEFKDYRLVYLLSLVLVDGNGAHQIHSFIYETISTLTKLFGNQVSVVDKDSLDIVYNSDLLSILLSEFN